MADEEREYGSMVSSSTTSRQQEINEMDVGESVAIAHRIDLSFGIAKDTVSGINRLLRGRMDQQANRARRATKGTYTVENGQYLTSDGSVILVCTVTRIG